MPLLIRAPEVVRTPRALLDLEERPRLPRRNAETLAHICVHTREAEGAVEALVDDDAEQTPDARLARSNATDREPQLRVEAERIGSRCIAIGSRRDGRGAVGCGTARNRIHGGSLRRFAGN